MILSSPGAALAIALILSLALTPLFRGWPDASACWTVRTPARHTSGRAAGRRYGDRARRAARRSPWRDPGWAATPRPCRCCSGPWPSPLIGLSDDRAGAAPRVTRLVAQLGVVGARGRQRRRTRARAAAADARAASSARWPPLAAILWIVTVVNFFNFLDGIDGLASLQALITGCGHPARGPGIPSLALAGSGRRGRRAGLPALQLVTRQRVPRRRRQLLPGLHPRGAAAGRPAAAAVPGGSLRGA